MKYAILAVIILGFSAQDASAGIFFRNRPGIFARASFRPQPIIMRSPMVYRGGWVPREMIRGRR